jgi:hypothetical protein
VASLVQVVAGSAGVPAHAASGPGDAVAASESAALAKARSSGSPVEVGALRGESREVYAQPDGTFEAVQHLRPVRTRQGGKWVPIDTTLKKRADGSVGPVASSVDLTFSGGGNTPMATMTVAGRRLSLSWPGTLPAPELDGSTATYRDVIDGVDLQLHADVDGFSHVLVVKNRQAAQDPRLATLTFTTATSGVTMAGDGSGGLRATDTGGGGAVFEARGHLGAPTGLGTGRRRP